MSDSSSDALAACSAACRVSSGTRWNTLLVASEIQQISSSNGFSSSCTLCRLQSSTEPLSMPSFSKEHHKDVGSTRWREDFPVSLQTQETCSQKGCPGMGWLAEQAQPVMVCFGQCATVHFWCCSSAYLLPSTAPLRIPGAEIGKLT